MKQKRLTPSTPLRLYPSTTLRLCLSMALLPLFLTSCHKTCTCIGYDGGSHSYTAEEVDERGVTCPDMVFFGGVQYYSVCSWD